MLTISSIIRCIRRQKTRIAGAMRVLAHWSRRRGKRPARRGARESSRRSGCTNLIDKRLLNLLNLERFLVDLISPSGRKAL
jgi:hypothetical protein